MGRIYNGAVHVVAGHSPPVNGSEYLLTAPGEAAAGHVRGLVRQLLTLGARPRSTDFIKEHRLLAPDTLRQGSPTQLNKFFKGGVDIAPSAIQMGPCVILLFFVAGSRLQFSPEATLRNTGWIGQHRARASECGPGDGNLARNNDDSEIVWR